MAQITDMAAWRAARARPITDMAAWRAARARPITDMAAWRAARARPITDACAWSAAVEHVTLANLRIMFAWQRVLLRIWT